MLLFQSPLDCVVELRVWLDGDDSKDIVGLEVSGGDDQAADGGVVKRRCRHLAEDPCAKLEAGRGRHLGRRHHLPSLPDQVFQQLAGKLEKYKHTSHHMAHDHNIWLQKYIHTT